jgi:hypothetical protein
MRCIRTCIARWWQDVVQLAITRITGWSESHLIELTDRAGSWRGGGGLPTCKFKVCKSVHHRTTQINRQPDATIFQFIILTFIYSSTCFGRFPAHHQELNDCSGSLWFYLRIVVVGPTTNTARLSPRYEGKTRGCHCSHWAPDDERKTPETCWAVNKRQDNKLKNCCFRLVIYLNCTMMHGLTNLKFYI